MSKKKLHPSSLVLRCLALERDSYWVAMCIDLDLAVQASTAKKAKELLRAQMYSYIEDALGVDSEHAPSLLNRRAPLRYFAMYYGIKWLNHAKGWLAYEAAMPVTPAHA